MYTKLIYSDKQHGRWPVSRGCFISIFTLHQGKLQIE